jgi:PAS domain S-box-containing protein
MTGKTGRTEGEMDEKQGILIVDDDESTLRTLALIFEQKGYETETALTGQEALEKARERFFNLALLDIKLSDMEGVELLAPLKKMHPNMVVIIITGHASLETAVQALNEGAAAYITKPLNMDEVLITVKEGLKKQWLVMENERLYEEAQRELAERKRAEGELKKSEKRYRSLVEDINDGYFIIQDSKFVYVNQAFADLSGYKKEIMLGKDFSRFFPREYLKRLSKDGLKGKGVREHVAQNEFEISRKDEENLVLEIRSRVIDYSGKLAIAGICKDITERKKAEMALREKVEELEKWYQVTVHREVKMTQLKKRIQELESELKLTSENQVH